MSWDLVTSVDDARSPLDRSGKSHPTVLGPTLDDLFSMADATSSTGRSLVPTGRHGDAEPRFVLALIACETGVLGAAAMAEHGAIVRLVGTGDRDLTMLRMVSTDPDLSAYKSVDASAQLAQRGDGMVSAWERGLTRRELEVLREIATGKSNREIAETLFISVATVKRHLTTMFGKLGLPSRSALNTFAHAHGLAAGGGERMVGSMGGGS